MPEQADPLDRWAVQPSAPPPQTPPPAEVKTPPVEPSRFVNNARLVKDRAPENTLEQLYRRAVGWPAEGMPASVNDPSSINSYGTYQNTTQGILKLLGGIDWLAANAAQAEEGGKDIAAGNYAKGAVKVARSAGTAGLMAAAPELAGALAVNPVVMGTTLATTGGAMTWSHAKVREAAKAIGATDDQADLAAEVSMIPVGLGTAKAGQMAGQWNKGRLTEKAFQALIKGVPRTGERMYEREDIATAMPHINAHSTEPITTVQEGLDASQKAISGIAERVRGYVLASPNDQVAGNAWQRMMNRLGNSQQDDFTRRGLAWIERKYGSKLSQGSISLKDADEIREELNAFNRKAMNDTRTNKADLQKTDPAFAARENLAESLRNDIYDHLEVAKQIPGVRDMRRAEGSIMKLRNAFEGALPRADTAVGGTAPFAAVRDLADVATRLSGANALTHGAASRVARSPANRTANEMVERFHRIRPYDDPATYPAVPPPFVPPPPGPPGPPLGRTQTAWWPGGPPGPPGAPGAPVASHPTPPPPAPPPTPAPPGPVWGGPGAVPTGAGRTPAAQAAANAAAARPAPGPADPLRQALEALAVEAQAQGVQFTHDRGQAAVQAIATGRMSAAQAASTFGQQRLPPSQVITPAAPPGSIPQPPPSGGGAVPARPVAVEMGPGGQFRPTQLSSDPAQTGPPTVTAAPLATGQRQIGPARTVFGTANPTTLNPEDMYQPPTGPYPPRPPAAPMPPASVAVREPGRLTVDDLTPQERGLYDEILSGPKPMPPEDILALLAEDRAASAAAPAPTTAGEVVAPAKPSRGKKKASAPVSDEGVIVGHEIDPHTSVKGGGYRAIRSTEPGATPAPLLTDARRAMLERMVADFENFPPTPGTLVEGSEQWRYGYDREKYVRGAAGTHVSDDIRVFSGRHGSNGEMRQAIEQLLSGATPSNKLHTAALAAADGYLAGELRPPLTPGDRARTVADVLGTGEVQPRLPEAGAVRDVDVPTPTMEAPFSLSGGVSERPQGKTSDLFAAPVEPAPSPYPADKAKWGPAQWEQFNKLRAAGLMPEQARRRVNKDMKKD
jgi:hypothetical protein